MAKKTLLLALIVSDFSTLLYTIYLDDLLYRTAPRKPDPSTKRIYPQHIQGYTLVYVRYAETLPFTFGWYLFFFCAVTAGILDQKWKVFRNPVEEMPKKFY